MRGARVARVVVPYRFFALPAELLVGADPGIRARIVTDLIQSSSGAGALDQAQRAHSF